MYVGKILVGIDGSPNSAVALRWAVEEATGNPTEATAGNAAEVIAVHAFFVPALAYSAPGFIPAEALDGEAESKTVLDAALEGMPASRTAGVARRVVDGYPPDALARAAEEPGVAMVVIGARGHGKVEELLLGSVSHSLAHRCHKPLVIVPPKWAGGDGRVVVGFHGAPESMPALRWAIEHARRRGGSVQVITVQDAHGAGHADRSDHAGDALGTALAQFDTSSVNITTEVVAGHPAEALLERAGGADLLVVGTRGLGRLREALTGSVTHVCAEHSPVPVAIVRNPA